MMIRDARMLLWLMRINLFGLSTCYRLDLLNSLDVIMM